MHFERVQVNRKERTGVWVLGGTIMYLVGTVYKWLFSRVTNGPLVFISRILISRMAAVDHIFLIIV